MLSVSIYYALFVFSIIAVLQVSINKITFVEKCYTLITATSRITNRLDSNTSAQVAQDGLLCLYELINELGI